VLTYK